MDGIVFGKPQAPAEFYEAFAKDARLALLDEIRKGDEGADAVMAALHLTCEDDAIKSRTHIVLPVQAFSKRLDSLVTECSRIISRDASHEQQLLQILNHVYAYWGLKIARDMQEGVFSPYRVYMEKVLSQKCGTQASASALLDSLFKRLYESGTISFRPQVAIPMEVAALPTAGLRGQQPLVYPQEFAATNGSSGAAPPQTGRSLEAGAFRWVCPRGLVVEMLDQLKRFYWSWFWPVNASSGFEACATALLDDDTGRAGKINAAVGVIQATGRPFGDVERSFLATERLAEITRLIDPDSFGHAMQVRDYGVLLLHLGRIDEGRQLLSGYKEWLQRVDPSKKPGEEETFSCIVDELLASQRLQGNQENGSSGFLDPDRDA